jgi:hypothetical protein
LTGLLRAAELETPASKPLLPARRVRFRHTGAVAGVAASAAAVALAVIAVSFPSAGRNPGGENLGAGSAPETTCAVCDVARVFVSERIAPSTTARRSPARRRYPPEPA